MNTNDGHAAIFGRVVFLPIPLGIKHPVFKGWKNVTHEQSLAPAYQTRLLEAIEKGGNIGVLLGAPSDYLVAFDWDTDELAEEFLALNPAFRNTTRTKGERGCQFFARLKPDTYPNKQAYYVLQTSDGQKAGEFRCGGIGGAQSVIYGKHPHGMHYQFLNDAAPIEIDYDSIRWPPRVVLPWLKTPLETKPELTPIAVIEGENRFQRTVLEEKIPIGFGQRLDSIFAAELGKHLAPYAFFERSGHCVELEFDYKLGAYQLAEADGYSFRTDIEAVVEPYTLRKVKDKKTKKESWIEVRQSIPLVLARTVLASKDFLEQLRPLYGFSAMRVPILRRDGRVELLPEGYDERSGILTVSTPEANYAELSYTLEEAVGYLKELFSEFCFHPEDRERAMSVVLAGMLTMYCRQLLGPKTQKPGFLYSANSEGAGKTLLAKLAIIPHLGFCPTGTVPDNEEEFRKRKFSVALADSPVFFLDNVKGYLNSGSLESFMTSAVVEDRILGASRLLKLEHNAVVFITGNSATYSPDIRRRTLLVELFLEEMLAEDREIVRPLNDRAITQKRAEILAVLWTLVKEWIAVGMPKASTSHASFPIWADVVGGIIEHAGFASPCTEAKSELSGDPDTQDMAKLVDLMIPARRYTYTELIDQCQTYDLFDALVPDQGPQDGAQRSQFGKLLRRYNGRVLNRKFKFLICGDTRKTRFYMVKDLTP
jgi:hypothetical protein